MKSAGEKEIITLGRAAFAGSQRYGAAVWSGDIHSTFEDLQQQVRAGFNMVSAASPGGRPISAVSSGAIPARPIFRN